jgi:hypothetical protein
MNKNLLITSLVVLFVAGGVGFYSGMKFQQSKNPTRQLGNFAGRNGTGGNNAFRPVNGQVLSVGTNTMTVKLNDGSSKVVILTGTTQINKAAQGTTADLTAGTTVSVLGQTNSDGSVTAQSVQLNPIVRGNNQPQGQ